MITRDQYNDGKAFCEEYLPRYDRRLKQTGVFAKIVPWEKIARCYKLIWIDLAALVKEAEERGYRRGKNVFFDRPTHIDTIQAFKAAEGWLQSARTYRAEGCKRSMRKAALLWRTEIARASGDYAKGMILGARAKSVGTFIDDFTPQIHALLTH